MRGTACGTSRTTWPAGSARCPGRRAARSWLDSGRYLVEFRKHGAYSRTDASSLIGTVTLWDITTRSLFWYLFHETINRVQRPPAEILVGPQGGLQTLIFFDDLPPQVWEISGDLPGYAP
jgi:hypothetical protein